MAQKEGNQDLYSSGRVDRLSVPQHQVLLLFVFPSHFSSPCELRSCQAETFKILSQLQ